MWVFPKWFTRRMMNPLFVTNTLHHQAGFTHTSIVTTAIHHIIVRPLHTEQTTRMDLTTFMNLTRSVQIPHHHVSINGSRHQTITLRRPADRCNGTLVRHPLSLRLITIHHRYRHQRLHTTNLPHLDVTSTVSRGDSVAIGRERHSGDALT